MINHDVHDHLHALRVQAINKGAELGLGSEVWVDVGEVGDPVAVIRGTPRLHVTLLERRSYPNGSETHVLESLNPVTGGATVGESG